MKKSIYELERNSLKILIKEFRKNAYYKQYVSEFVTALMVLTIVSACLIGIIIGISNLNYNTVSIFIAISFILVLGFATIITINFAIKRLDLLKIYYEEKK